MAAVAFATTATARTEAELQPWKGGATPPLALRDLQDRTLSLRDLRGKVVVVNFWASWCEPCRDEMPSLERLRAKLGDRRLEVVAVNYGESRARVEEFARRHGLTIPMLLDPDKSTADRWRARGLPMTFIVDARGRVRYWLFGENDWTGAATLRTLEALLAEAPRARR